MYKSSAYHTTQLSDVRLHRAFRLRVLLSVMRPSCRVDYSDDDWHVQRIRDADSQCTLEAYNRPGRRDSDMPGRDLDVEIQDRFATPRNH